MAASRCSGGRCSKVVKTHSTSVCEGAAVAGRLDVLRWLREVVKLPWDLGREQLAACKRGDLQLLRWVCDAAGSNTLADPCSSLSISAAAASGSVDLLAWLELNRCLRDAVDRDVGLAGAIGAGQLDSVRYLCIRDNTAGEVQLLLAARRGHAALVEFLHKEGCSLYAEGVDSGLEAARSGSVAVLAYIHAHEPEAFTKTNALKDMLHCCMRLNHLDAAKWLREQGAPWPNTLWFFDDADEYLVNSTDLMQTCSLEMLQWAIAAGCPYGNDWEYGTCNELRVCGYAAEVEWMHANGCPCGDDCPARRK
jgi:hypothetical protein